MPLFARRSITGPKAPRSSASDTWVNDSHAPPDGEPRPRFDLAADRIRREIPRRRVPALVLASVTVDELLHRTVQKPASELVAEGIHMIGSIPTRRGARWPMGKNCTNSMSTSAAPARSASA